MNAAAAESILSRDPNELFDAKFVIEADGAVDAVYRISGVLLLANRAIARASVERVEDERILAQVEMTGLTLTTVTNLLRKLSQLTCAFDTRAFVVGADGRFNARLTCSPNEGICMQVRAGPTAATTHP